MTEPATPTKHLVVDADDPSITFGVWNTRPEAVEMCEVMQASHWRQYHTYLRLRIEEVVS